MKFNINCDLGEGMSNDKELMPYINECNIACGGHFGNLNTIIQTIQLAKKHNVLVGAHPSFPDKENFGRKNITISDVDLAQSLHEQISLFLSACSQLAIKMNHIKLHGALYNLSCNDAKIAQLVLDVYLQFDHKFKLFVPYQSVIAQLAQKKFKLSYEAFIDRRYNDDLSLVNRKHKNAIIKNPKNACEQVKSIYSGHLTTLNGHHTKIKADTFCLHGDNPKALELAQYLQKQCQ